MPIKATILEAIGNTPLVRLNRVTEPGSAELLAKCEYMNPAGSIKDRMALYIIEQAEKEGLLKPGGTIVENTSGNTGLGVAMTAAVKGYKCVFTMPDKMSLEKVNMLKSFGCDVVITPTDVPGDSPDHYVNVAKRIAKETPGSYYLDQYHNQWNIDAHYHSTGREIWEETDGQFDAFVGGTGTGGTVSGVGRYIKDQLKKGHDRDVRVIGVDPLGSVHYHYFHTRTIPNAYVYKVEGIGEDIKCEAFDPEAADEMRQVNDQESFDMARRLVREEGLFCGGSSGSIVHVAAQVAKEMGEGKTVIAVLPDSGTRYITKYLSDAWMKDHGFLEKRASMGLVEDLLATRDQNIITASESAPLESLVGLLRDNGVSQVPITNGQKIPVSIVHEIDLLRALHQGETSPTAPASSIAQPIGGLIYPKARIEELYHIFETDQVAIVVDNGQIAGVISQIDLIEYLSR